jgi:hypothetical protein
MDQLVTHKNLTKKEKSNVFLAIAAGCLSAIDEMTPGPDHQRKKRELLKLRSTLIKDIGPVLPRVTDHNLELFKDTIHASDKVLKKIIDTPQQTVHVLLNLAGFCLHELPLKNKHWEKFNTLFDFWPNAYKHQDILLGDRIFHRIESEVQILVAQRGGVIL